jgi:hypothetical protein
MADLEQEGLVDDGGGWSASRLAQPPPKTQLRLCKWLVCVE